jgi:hypothetical protein
MQKQDSKKQQLKTLDYEAGASSDDQPQGFWSGGREFIKEFIVHVIGLVVGVPVVILILIYGGRFGCQ